MTTDLYNADCLEIMDKLIAKGIVVDAIITDPPYKVISGGKPNPKKNTPSGMLKKNDGKIFEHNGLAEKDWFPKIHKLLKEGGHCYLMVNALNLEKYLRLARENGFMLHNLLVWEKNNCTPNKWYMKNCEYTLFLRKGRAKFINNIGSKTVHRFMNVSQKEHPTQKPVGLMKFYIENSTERGDSVLDFAMGSGTTGCACQLTDRNFIGIELDKKYFDIAQKRINEALGLFK